MPQVDPNYSPKFNLGEMVLFGGGVCRVIGREQFLPGNLWFYLLGAKVGKHKMVWHQRVFEAELQRPCNVNVIELNKRR